MGKTPFIVIFCCILLFCGCERVEYITETSYITDTSYIIDTSYIYETSVEVSYIEPNTEEDYVIIDVPLICQNPLLPTGCEATSAAMLLNFYGENITHTQFAKLWLNKSQDFYTYNGKQYGPNPNTHFAGDPFSQYAYGCYAPVIEQAINQNSTTVTAKTLYGISLTDLCSEYIDNGTPVLVWATMGMTESAKGKSWITPEGNEFTWISGEHCLVLVGYDDNYYFFNDPLYGNTVGYKRDVCEKRYNELGMQALICRFIA